MVDRSNPDYENTPVSPRRPLFVYAPHQPTAAPRVSIVTPFYNEGSIFHETACSVFRQSFQEWEWIIVNDASTSPEALEVLDTYRASEPRVRVIDQPRNQGPSAARNVAFRLAQAEYVVHLDSDNLLEPTAIEKWLWFLESHPEYAFVKGLTVGFGAQTYLWEHGFHSGSKFLVNNQVDTTSMIRRRVHQAVGGFDESIRGGLEDWEFWLRCANAGFWGGTVPEFLDWYRRRALHSDRWKTWDGDDNERRFAAEMRRRYPALWDGKFPHIQIRQHSPNETVPDDLPCVNVLEKKARRILLIVPWFALGGSDKFTLDLIEQLIGRGWQVTVATTLGGPDPWDSQYAHRTPDVFVLHRFLRVVDYPRFLRYLIGSRRPDIVMVSHSELGYHLLPYFRAHFPEVPFVDFCHIEEQWKNGGYPRMSVEYREQLDLTMVTSEHLKRWMVARGAEADRIKVCYICVNPDKWRPDATTRAAVRRQLRVDDQVCVILYAARICAQKQPRVLVATMARLQRNGTRVLAVVAGDGPDLDALRDAVDKHGLGKTVRLLGAVPNDTVSELIKAADVFFLPSEWEGIALSIYEAMASGVPVVSADVGGQRELVTADCGVLIPRGSEEQEAEEYARVLTEMIADPGKRRAMGEAGRARIRAGFRLDQMGQTMAEQLDRAIRLHDEHPQHVPGVGLGRACASQAVEYVRIVRVAEELWHARAGVLETIKSTRGLGWRERAYTICRTLYEPLYRRGTSKGGAWYFPLAERLKAALIGSQR